jgi:hypothetical protein
MIILKQTFDLHPATPATRDRFVDHAKQTLVPGWSSLGGELKAAFFSTEEWFYQVTHATAFPDLAAFDVARRSIEHGAEFADLRAENESLAPRRGTALLENLGPVPAETLDAGIAKAGTEPAGEYTVAILEVLPGRMPDFTRLLEMGAPQLPILASWRDVVGDPHRVIDLWRGNPGQVPYEPADPTLEGAFFAPLREVAPRERMMRLFPLPYSPLT